MSQLLSPFSGFSLLSPVSAFACTGDFLDLQCVLLGLASSILQNQKAHYHISPPDPVASLSLTSSGPHCASSPLPSSSVSSKTVDPSAVSLLCIDRRHHQFDSTVTGIEDERQEIGTAGFI
ncbi:unnamed protein product [Linum trigynum]|uniref:Secreted protein n=1 Tax=Linum trigynum TaxID=586398 RepID=A0AAV2FTV5_9ROSI